MTSKQRAFLISLASREQAILHIGRAGLTPELTESVKEALEARELIKINIQQNCLEVPDQTARMLAERTGSEVVHIIGRKIVLYRPGKGKKKKIELPQKNA